MLTSKGPPDEWHKWAERYWARRERFYRAGKGDGRRAAKALRRSARLEPITSTLIYGEHDAVLVDAMTTVAEAEALADWIALHNRNSETIYITHCESFW